MIPSFPFAKHVEQTRGAGEPLQWVVTDAAEVPPGQDFMPVGMGYLYSQHAATTIRARLEEAAAFPVEFRIVERRAAELLTIASGICDANTSLHYTAWTHPLRAIRDLYQRPGCEMQYRNRGETNWRTF